MGQTGSLSTFPGRSAAQSGALQTRGPGAATVDPGSAPHRSASLHAAVHPGNAQAAGFPSPRAAGAAGRGTQKAVLYSRLKPRILAN
jgi:hypothetical protein